MASDLENIKELINNKTAFVAISVFGSVLLVIIAVLLFMKSDTISFDTYTVSKGDMEIYLVESGEIKAVNYIEISAPGTGRRSWEQQLPQIVYLIPEGTRVDKGDTLIRFDVSALQTQRETLEEQLLTAQQTYDELLETIKSQEETDIRSLQNAHFSIQNSRLNQELAQFEPETTKKNRELQLQIQILDSLKTAANISASRASREFNRTKALDNIKEIQNDISEIDRKIQSYSILAPFPGLVVHKAEGWPVPVTVKEGDSPYPGQRLIQLPDLSSVKATMHINDFDRNRVWEGQRGRLRLEAYPDKVFEGQIVDLGILPQNAISFGYSNLKIVEAEFLLDETDEIFRPGMSATVELIVDRVEDALLVPLGALFELNGKTYVYLDNDGNPKPREVSLGKRNDCFAEVTGGINEGDVILKNDPFYYGFRVGQYDEWQRQNNAIAALGEHFGEIEKLGIQYDYNRFRSQTPAQGTREEGAQRVISDDMIKQFLERMGQEATPENIQRAREMMQQRTGRGMGGGQGMEEMRQQGDRRSDRQGADPQQRGNAAARKKAARPDTTIIKR